MHFLSEGQRLAQTSPKARYTSRIIKAGALLADTKLLLENWDQEANVQTNLDRMRQENLFGKTSRSRIEDILLVFRQRYLKDPEILKGLVTLIEGGMAAETLDRVLYFQAVRSDPLLHDLVTEVLADWSTRSDREVRTREVMGWVDEQVQAGHTERPWSFEVQRRVVQGLLATLRDFGVLEGSVKKQLAYFLPATRRVRLCRLSARQRGAFRWAFAERSRVAAVLFAAGWGRALLPGGSSRGSPRVLRSRPGGTRRLPGGESGGVCTFPH